MSKPALILLHGALGAAAQFEALHPLLTDHFELYSFSFSGHGGNSLDGVEFSMAQFSNDLVDYMDTHNIRQANIFGYSMGGYVALQTARTHPARVGAILTLATKFNWTPESAEKESRMLNPEKIQEKVPQFAAALGKRHEPADWKEVLHKTAAMMRALGNGAALSPDQLADIAQPVTISVGDQDNMVSQEESAAAAAALPQGSFRVLEGVAHPIEQVDKAFLAALILEILS